MSTKKRPTGRKKTVGQATSSVWKKPMSGTAKLGTGVGTSSHSTVSRDNGRGGGGVVKVNPSNGSPYRVIVHDHGKEIKFKG